MSVRVGKWWIWLVCFSVAACIGSSVCNAEPRDARQLRLSSIVPIQQSEPFREEASRVEQWLSDTLLSLWADEEPRFTWPYLIPLRDHPIYQTRRAAVLRSVHRREFVGPTPRSSAGLHALRLAAIQPMLPATRPSGGGMLDGLDVGSSLGRLAQNPSGLFNSFEVRVSVSGYTLELYGMRNDGARKLLYSCKVGLGSSEFPTPRGSYYLMRIYDDKPLWIPPDRPWAWGEQPSHSVYGGHMLPLFTKSTLRRAGIDADVVDSLDVIASPVKLEDAGMYRIHGTDSPWSIGSGQSHGCVRLHNKSVKQLADALKLYVGQTSRGRSPNGAYCTLARPVKMVLF
ncbi:MAG: L,D-transpeptidase [Desulfomonile tiedjei]|nr:L,D-transpeptidase [Desulfomonile tiedjei]